MAHLPRSGLSAKRIVECALSLVDESGADALTLTAVASRAGVAAPSLYSHIRSLAELRSLLAAWALDQLAGRLRHAVLGRSADDAVRALMLELRAFALENPRRYTLLPLQPAGDPLLESGAQDLLEVFRASLRGYRLDRGALVHAVRRIRAATDGFVRLEIGGGFGLPEDVETSYRLLVEAILASLPAASAPVARA